MNSVRLPQPQPNSRMACPSCRQARAQYSAADGHAADGVAAAEHHDQHSACRRWLGANNMCMGVRQPLITNSADDEGGRQREQPGLFSAPN